MKWLKGRNDHFSFEIVKNDGLISFYVDTTTSMQALIEQQIHAQYPSAEIIQITDYNLFNKHSAIVGAYLTAKNSSALPIKTYKNLDSDPLSSILNTLSKIQQPGSSAAVQIVARAATTSWRADGAKAAREIKQGKKFEEVLEKQSLNLLGSFGKLFSGIFKHVVNSTDTDSDKKPDEYKLSSMEEEMIKGIEQKIAKGGLEITIRLLASADDDTTAKHHLDNLIHAFNQYNYYRFGNSLTAVVPKRAQKHLIRDFIYRSFHDKRSMVMNTEELASLWHLPLTSTEAPNIDWLTGRSAPPPVNAPQEGILMGHVDYRGLDVKIRMKDADRRRHLYVIGKSGSGKSVFIKNLAIQDIQNGKGVCVVDPHGDLVEDILEHIPKSRADDIVVFNPSDLEYPIGLNMLEARTEEEKDFAVQEMISIFYKLFPPEMMGPMFEHNMRNVMLTLMADPDNPGTIIDIPRMFTDDDFVKKYLKKLKDPVVRAFWEKEKAKETAHTKSEMLGYLVSKVGRFVENGMMRNIMGQQKSGFNFRDIMDNKKILLVNLAKGKTGEINAKLLGLIIVSKLQMAAFGRADMPESERHDFYLYIDEFQNFITDSIESILSEARKYRLNLIIAHQYMAQLQDEKGRAGIRDAVLGNAGTLCSFRIGPEDSEILAKEFAPTFGAYDLLNTPRYSCYTKLLIDSTASKPFNMKTYPPESGNRNLADIYKQLSRLKFGRARFIVEDEILERTDLANSHKQSFTDMIEASL
jgi:hypothetical protein